MHRRKQIFFLLAVLLCLSVFAFSAWNVGSYYLAGQKSQSRYQELAAMAATLPSDTEESASSPESGILPEYQALYEQNPHMVGWITIDGTLINYPVVQTPEDPEYYLYRDFDGNDNARGCLFADAACDVEASDNVTVYGHHMVDGSMFTGLLNLAVQSFWEEHPTFRFDSLTQRRTYEIFAVFRTTASVGEGFAYHEFVDAADEAEFDAFIARCKALSLYETGITPAYGDRIVCLSTCEYSRENGRFIVAAVQKK